MEKKDGSIPAGPLLHLMFTIVLIRLAETPPSIIEGSRNTTPATALPAPGSTQRCLASAHNIVRVLFMSKLRKDQLRKGHKPEALYRRMTPRDERAACRVLNATALV